MKPKPMLHVPATTGMEQVCRLLFLILPLYQPTNTQFYNDTRLINLEMPPLWPLIDCRNNYSALAYDKKKKKKN